MKSFEILGKFVDDFCQRMIKYKPEIALFYKKIYETHLFETCTYSVVTMTLKESTIFRQHNHDYCQYN